MLFAQEAREKQARITKDIEDYLDGVIQSEIAYGNHSAWVMYNNRNIERWKCAERILHEHGYNNITVEEIPSHDPHRNNIYFRLSWSW